MSHTNKGLAACGLFILCLITSFIVTAGNATPLYGLVGNTINDEIKTLEKSGYIKVKNEPQQQLWYNQHEERCARLTLDGNKITAIYELAGNKCLSAPVDTISTSSVDKEVMTQYCTGLAAEKFSQPSNHITTLPIETADNQFIVYGEYGDDESDSDIITFRCSFSTEGNFNNIHKLT